MALSDQILHAYNLDESSGNAADSVGSATLTNNGTTPYVAGLINNGADFEDSGSAQYLNNVSDIAPSAPSAFTINLWYKPESLPGSGDQDACFYQDDNDGQVFLGPRNNAGTPVVRLRVFDSLGGSTVVEETVTLTTGVFYMLTGVWSGTTVTLYRNATSVAGPSALLTFGGGNSAGFSFGAYVDGSVFKADGVLDVVAYWNRALSGAEITSLYNGGAGLQYPYVSGPAGVKTWNGVTQSTGINTYDGLALASTKSVDGVT